MAESVYLRDYLTGLNGFARTAFGEVSVNITDGQIAWNFQYAVNPALITSAASTGGSVSSSSAQAVLQTSTSSTGYAEISTINALRHLPGIGGVVRFTALFTEGKTNSKQIVGIGDSQDGYFFGYNSTSFGVLRRVGGVDNWIPQSEWSDMEITDLDPTKGNVYQIKFQWLGYGEIDFYVENRHNGSIQLVHRLKYSNANTTPSILSPSLPLHARVENTGNNTNIAIRTPSGMAGLEGNIHNGALETINGIANSFASISALRPIVTAKNSTEFYGLANRTRLRLNQISVAGDGTQNVNFTVYLNGALSTATAYTYPSSNTTPLLRDIASTSITGGTLLLSYFLGKAESRAIDVTAYGIYIAPGQWITIAASSSGATTAYAAMNLTTVF